MFPAVFVGYSPTLFSADFTAATPGGASSLPSGLLFSRASSGYSVQSSSTTVVTANLGVDVPRIGYDGTHRGLLLEESRINIVATCNPKTWTAGAGATITAIAGPRDTGTSASVEDSSDSVRQFALLAYSGITPGNPYIASCWAINLTPANGGVGWVQNDTVYECRIQTTTTTWQRIFGTTLGAVQASGSINASPQHDNVALKGINGLDFVQIENGKFATEVIDTAGGSATRAGERLWFARTPVHSGTVNLEVSIQPKAIAASYGASMRVLTVDSSNYVEVNTSGQVICVVGGASQTLGTAMSWAAFDTVDLFVQVGNRAPKAQYRVNGGTVVQLGEGTAQAAIASGGTCDVLCNGTSNQFTSWVRKIVAYAKGVKPSWAS